VPVWSCRRHIFKQPAEKRSGADSKTGSKSTKPGKGGCILMTIRIRSFNYEHLLGNSKLSDVGKGRFTSGPVQGDTTKVESCSGGPGMVKNNGPDI